ncbi:hypothetical protein ACHHYP_08470 [Achlya hypogyna]|uniref:Fibronectin type-III domain-containing protein n=1 Tax=Achlya hypogyna TaxID=1202772 RepID=A0A1V9YPE7_ACHHY|nr:hypothetical protein ACHHYP_08470 [Achlya hypogyna]
MEDDCALEVPSGVSFVSVVPVPLSVSCLTVDFLLRPPLVPSVALWLLHHQSVAVGILHGHIVVRILSAVFTSADPCATENVVQHWAMQLKPSTPLLFRDGVPQDLVPLGDRFAAATLAEPDDTDGHVRLGWTSRRGPPFVLGEVRVWDAVCVSPDVLQQWRLREISPDHPHVAQLAAYWRLNSCSLGASQPDLSGHGRDINAVGGGASWRWAPLWPLQLEAHPSLVLQMHHAPAAGRPLVSEFFVHVGPDAAGGTPSAHAHVLLLVDATAINAEEMTRWSVALSQFVTALPSHTTLCIATTLRSTAVQLPWRTLDPLGQREAIKHATNLISKPPAHPPAPLRPIALRALELLTEKYRELPSAISVGALLVLTRDGATLAELRDAYEAVQAWCTVHVLRLAPAPPAAPPALQYIEYAAATVDLEFIFADIVHQLTHVVAKHVRVCVETTGLVQLDVDAKYDAQATSRAVVTDGSRIEWLLGLFSAADAFVLSGRLQWSARDADESVHVAVTAVQAGILVLARSAVVLPPYPALHALIRGASRGVGLGRVRAESTQAERLFHARRRYLAEMNATDVADAQKGFEQLRAAKEAQLGDLQAIQDDVAAVEQRKDVLRIIEETAALLQSLVAPKVSPKRSVVVAVDPDARDTPSGPVGAADEAKSVEWVESLASLTAKANVEEADAKLEESLRSLRQVDDDLKRRPVFTTDDEIRDVLGWLVTRLHETQLARRVVFVEMDKHAHGSKRVLVERMTSTKQRHAAGECAALRRTPVELQTLLDARRIADPTALRVLKPALLAERTTFGRYQLAWGQARFAELLKDRPIPNALVPFATLLLAPCGTRGMRNAVQALVFSLRCDRDPATLVPVCPVVHDHTYPIWWADEQLSSVAIAPEQPDAEVAALDTARLALAKARVAHVLVLTSNAFFADDDAVAEVLAYHATRRPLLHVQVEALCTDAAAFRLWQRSTGGTERAFVDWDANRQRVLQALPPPANATMLALDAFECPACQAVDDVRQLLRSPCYRCSFFTQDRPAYVAFVAEVAALLSSARCTASVSALVWKTEPPTSTLPQLRRFYAERVVGAAKDQHSEATKARADAIRDYRDHAIERIGADLGDFDAVRARLVAVVAARRESVAEIFTEYQVQRHKLAGQLAAATDLLYRAETQLAAVVGDLESRVAHMALGTCLEDGDDLQRYRRGIPWLQQLAPVFLELNQSVYDLTAQCVAIQADLFLYAALTELDSSIEATVAATVAEVQAKVDEIETAYVAAVPAEATALFRLCNVQTFALSTANNPLLDLDALQRAVDDVVAWEGLALQCMQDLFQGAHAVRAVVEMDAKVAGVKDAFQRTYNASSNEDTAVALDAPMPAELLGDWVWCEKDCARPSDAWAAIKSMEARIALERAQRQLQHRHRHCTSLYLQAYVDASHAAWHSQCEALLERASQRLASAFDAVVAATPPRADAEKALRAALEDEGTCRHQLRRLKYRVDENAHVRRHFALTMLQLRHLATVESDVEAYARQHNLKETKPVWDELAAYQAECFAEGFSRATAWDDERVALEHDAQLLEAQHARSLAAVASRRSAWKASVWAHTVACVALSKTQSFLYKALETVVGLERKRQKDIESQIVLYVNGAVTDKEARVEFADSHLIQATMLRLEVQKQARLYQLAFNRARLLERMLRQETDLLSMTRDEAARKDLLTAAMKHRCEFVDATTGRLRSLGRRVAKKPKLQALYAALEGHLVAATTKCWREYREQTAAFAQDHWLVQHRRNAVDAVESLLEAAQSACARELALYDALVAKQAEAIKAPYTTPVPYQPLDTVHLMLFLNAKASAAWARTANMQRTGLHESMHLRRLDATEWLKVDPRCKECAAARLAYIHAENDLVLNRFEIKCADAQAVQGPTQCHQYVLTTMDNKQTVFLQHHPDPAHVDCAALGSWSASRALCVDVYAGRQKQLRDAALGYDLREMNFDCHERLLGGDVPRADVDHFYGPPVRLETERHRANRIAFCRAAVVARCVKRWTGLHRAVRARQQQERVAIGPLEEQGRRLAIEQGLNGTLLGPWLTRQAVESSGVLRQYLCAVVDLQLHTPAPSFELVPRLARCLGLHQANLRTWTSQFPCNGARRALHESFVTAFAQATHRPPSIPGATVSVAVASPTTVKVAWALPKTTGAKESWNVLLHVGLWEPRSAAWTWNLLLLPGVTRHTLTSLVPGSVYCVYVVLTTAPGLASAFYDTLCFTTPSQ